MNHILSTIGSWNIQEGDPVLLRADLNVKIIKGTFESEFRLKALQPTVDFLIKKGAVIILLTHRGRPKNKDLTLSTEHIIPWFKNNNYKIKFAPTVKIAKELSLNAQPGSLILFENLRFFSGEIEQSKTFAKALSKLGKWYINDAFGSIHRNATSTTLLPCLFDKRYPIYWEFLRKRPCYRVGTYLVNISLFTVTLSGTF